MVQQASPHSPAVFHGTLDALILKTLLPGPRHGNAIARWIEQATDHPFGFSRLLWHTLPDGPGAGAHPASVPP